MGALLNLLYLLATLLLLIVLLMQTLRAPPPPALHAGWPLRGIWFGEPMRRGFLGLLLLGALAWAYVVVGGALGIVPPFAVPGLLVGAVLLVLLGAASVVYSALLAWPGSAAKPDRF